MSGPAAIVIGIGSGGSGGGGGVGDMSTAVWDTDTNGAIDVAKGGTNATSAASALVNLGAAARGANNDITSLTGLTTPVDVTKGGTGSATAAGARTNLGLATVAASGLASDLTGTLAAAQLPALTGDVTSSAGSAATTIAAGAVTLAKQANLAANSIQGNNTGSPATPLALTAAQVKTLLAIASGDVSGLGALATKNSVAETDLSLTDVTTDNVSTSAHGFHPKLPNDAAQTFLGDGNYYAQPWFWRKLSFVFDDFLGGAATGSFNQTVSGSGAGWNFGTGDTTSAGIVTGATGTTTGGNARIGGASSGVPSNICLGSGVAYYECRFRLTQLSNGTDTFTLRIGMNDNVGAADATDGVYIRYTDGVNSGKFQLVTRSNGSETATDTGVTAQAATWYLVKITVNAAGTSVTCDINGTAVTASTNIPTGTARATALVSSLGKSAGTSSVTVDFDFIGFTYNFTTSR